MSEAKLHIGTSGWNYPSGTPANWSGIFYPKGVDDLEYYSRFFNSVEVNTTFYRPATSKMAKGWIERTPDGFSFSVKLWQKFTHPRMFKEDTGREAIVEGEDFRIFREVLDVLDESGRLGCLLVQFPPSFHATDRNIEGLQNYLVHFREYALAVEFRHRSWSDSGKEVGDVFSSLGVASVFIDEPKFYSSIEQKFEVTSENVFVRFHGRNKEKWWQHDQPWERYDYFYSNQELLPFSEHIQRLMKESKAKNIYVYFNNHAHAQAVASALMLADQLGMPLLEPLPSGMCHAYPDLKLLMDKHKPLSTQISTQNEEGQLRLL